MLAIEWYQKAANSGLAVAQYNLGIMYQLGLGLERDFKVAAAMYRQAAIQGYQPAQNNLAILLANGWGIKRDFKEAIKWLTLVTHGAEDKIAKQAEDNINTLSLKLLGDKDAVLQTYADKKNTKDKETFTGQIEREAPLPLRILNFYQPVVVLQRLLRELGYYNERVDGLRGTATESALKLACLKENLKLPTVVSKSFLERLFKILVSRSESKIQ